jgi:hypothetical protein
VPSRVRTPETKTPTPTREQRRWIDTRDRIGNLIDGYLSTKPSPEMTKAIRAVEDSLRMGDHAAGLN